MIIATKGDQHIKPESGNIYEIKTKNGERYVGDSSANYVYSGSGDDHLNGGWGDDHLNGNAGKDRFIYDNIGDGDDTILDFQVGSGTDSDVLDLANLLSYNQGDDINDFITLVDNSTNTSTLKIYADGNNTSVADVTIHLAGVTGTDLNTMIADGNIVLF